MNREEVKELFIRIKSNYPNFITDEYKLVEWCSELKDYDYEDVQKKLDEHLRNEQYGRTEPKVYFLTKYLTKKSDKGKLETTKVYCDICHRIVYYNDYIKHFSKCSSVDYLLRTIKKYNLKEITKEELESMPQEKFDKLYDNALKYILSNSMDKEEIDRIKKILKSRDDIYG